jgi:hypothetical protein
MCALRFELETDSMPISSPFNTYQSSEFPSSKCLFHIGRGPTILEILISANFTTGLTVSFIISLIKSICSNASLTTCLLVSSCQYTYGVRIQKLYILFTRYPNAHKHSSYFPFTHSWNIDVTRKLFREHLHRLNRSSVFLISSALMSQDLRTALMTYGRST